MDSVRILPTNSEESLSVLPGESGSLVEALGPTEGLAQASSGEPVDPSSASALTAAFNFTGTTASANGATMQEYFIQSVVSSPVQHELLLTRLHGLCREWSEFCDQEIVFEIGSDSRSDLMSGSNPSSVSNRAQTNSSAAAGILASNVASTGSVAVTMRVRRSLLSNTNPIGREFSVLRYLGAVETDKLVLRRSCLEMPVTGPLISFLHELGFEREFTYVTEGKIFIRGRVKILVYTVNEITHYHTPGSNISTQNPGPGTTASVSGSNTVNVNTNTSGMMPGLDSQDMFPKEWRRVCPNSWLVELSCVGSPADDSLQEEVAEFSELLHPLVIPTKLDHNLFNCK